MEMERYTKIFIEESKENVQSLNNILLTLEKNPDYPPLINDLFRIAHTLKSMSATMGFTKMAKLTHTMEDSLDQIRGGKKNTSPELIDLLFRCVDVLDGSIDHISGYGDEGEEDFKDIELALKASLQNTTHSDDSPTPTSCTEPTSAQTTQDRFPVETPAKASKNEVPAADRHVGLENTNQIEGLQNFPGIPIENTEIELYQQIASQNALYRVDLRLIETCVLKSARAFLFFKTLEETGQILKSTPTSHEIEDESFQQDISVLLHSVQSRDAIHKILNTLSEVETYLVSPITQNDLDNIQAFYQKNKDLHSFKCPVAENIQEKPAPPIFKHTKTVRVDIERLDILMNLVSELMVTKTQLERFASEVGHTESKGTFEYLHRITTQLHDAVMKVRMVPVESVFNRFPRMIRDLSKDLEKDISLLLSGEDTELDRSIIDEIGEPLIHLIRNSASHGIESESLRIERGKPSQGHIWLRAFQTNHHVIIEVEDDGSGIDLSQVREKAIEKKIISPENAPQLSEKELLDIIFISGFSTRDTVSDLSGRGVGLDAVRNKIQQLGGSIQIENRPLLGAKFIIKLPLTLSILHVLLFRIASEQYALPLESVLEIIQISKKDIQIASGKEAILYKDHVIPCYFMHTLLELEKKHLPDRDELLVLIVSKNGKNMGLIVDELIDQHDVVIKPLGKLFSGIPEISGATIQQDGSVALILDVNILV